MKPGDTFQYRIEYHYDYAFLSYPSCLCDVDEARECFLDKGSIIMFLGYKPCTCRRDVKVALFLSSIGILQEHCDEKSGVVDFDLWDVYMKKIS